MKQHIGTKRNLWALVPIIRTGSTILVDLIDMVNSVTVYLFQTTLLRWWTFILRPLTLILTSLHFWISFFDPSICSAVVVLPTRTSDYELLINFHWCSFKLKGYTGAFHNLALDYSGNDLDFSIDYLKDSKGGHLWTTCCFCCCY